MSKRVRQEQDITDNSTVYNRLLRFDFRCSFCPPNRYENAKRKGKHGRTKSKYKSKRIKK